VRESGISSGRDVFYRYTEIERVSEILKREDIDFFHGENFSLSGVEIKASALNKIPKNEALRENWHVAVN
jgi:hypothetical protein